MVWEYSEALPLLHGGQKKSILVKVCLMQTTLAPIRDRIFQRKRAVVQNHLSILPTPTLLH